MFYTKSFIIIAIMALLFAVQPFNCISVNEIPLKKEKMQQEISFIVSIMREQLKNGIFAISPNIALEQLAKSMCRIKFDEFENVFDSILLKNEHEALPPLVKIASQFCAILDTKEGGETFEQNAKFALKMLGEQTNLLRELSSLRNLIVEQLKKWEEAQQQKVPDLQKECQSGGHQQSLLLEQFHAFLEKFGQHLPEGLEKNAVDQLLAITARRQQATTLSTLFELITRDLWTDNNDNTNNNKALIDAANSDGEITKLFDKMDRRRRKRQIDPFSQLITFLFNLFTFLFAHQGDAPLALYIAFLVFLWLCKGVFWGRRF